MSWVASWPSLLAPVVVLAVVALDLVWLRRCDHLLSTLGALPLRVRGTVRTLLVVSSVLILLTVIARGVPSPGQPGGDATTDLMLVVDVSMSMRVDDVRPTRAGLARVVALRLATARGPHRVGLVAFASEAHLLLPPTGDRGLVSLYLESLDPRVVTGQGSDLADAIRVALGDEAKQGDVFPQRRRVVVVLSDGEGFEDAGALEEALDLARASGVPVHTIQTGTPEGGPVPSATPPGRSSAQPARLQAIAGATGGTALEATDGGAVAALAASFTQRERKPFLTAAYPGRATTMGLVGLAFLLLAAEWVVGAVTPPRMPL